MLNDVLCIDDDKITLMICKKVILMANFCKEVHTFQDAEKALDYIENLHLNHQELPDLIFLDLNMPVMDGWQFLDELHEKIKDTHTQIPIVILSSSVAPEDVLKTKDYKDVIKFIKKPVSAAELSTLIV